MQTDRSTNGHCIGDCRVIFATKSFDTHFISIKCLMIHPLYIIVCVFNKRIRHQVLYKQARNPVIVVIVIVNCSYSIDVFKRIGKVTGSGF